jgi:FxLD family lantipeptide
MPEDTLLLDRPAIEADDFALDVRVLVSYAPASRGDCPTDDGCGVTCATSASACSSNYEIPA